MKTEVFVFGSNLAGRHGAGAALAAKQHHGAIYGIGVGLQGSSYAIPTKDGRPGNADLSKPEATLSLITIRNHVKVFIAFAEECPFIQFNVTRIGCGRAGYTDRDIAPMFKDAPSNCKLPVEWLEVLKTPKQAELEVVSLRRYAQTAKFEPVRIDRTTPLGNPFHLEGDEHRDEVCEKFKVWADEQILSKKGAFYIAFKALYLRYYNGESLSLQCWCAPKRCHGDYIIELLKKFEAIQRSKH